MNKSNEVRRGEERVWTYKRESTVEQFNISKISNTLISTNCRLAEQTYRKMMRETYQSKGLYLPVKSSLENK